MSPKARAKEPPSESLARLIGRKALAVLLTEDVARFAATALVVSAIAAASLRARDQVLAREDLSIDRDSLAAALPAPLSDAAREELDHLAVPGRVSAFAPGLVPVVARELARLRWVDAVKAVRLEFPPKLVFSVSALRPVARLKEDGREWLVARDGRPVPLESVALPKDGFPRIDGLPGPRVPLDRARALDAGLAVVQALEARGLRSRAAVVAVDVANWDGRKDPKASELVLETTSGARIDWGRPEGASRAPSTAERLDRLEAFLTRGPKLESLTRLSLRWHEPVVVARPFETPSSPALAARRP